MEKSKTKNAKNAVVKPAPAVKAGPPPKASPPPAAVPVHVPPLFRRVDWLAFIIALAVVWVTYFLTLAPELTLEDSGELCTGSFYAGIPHPPGYPFWAIYSWLWTKLLPIGNVAWRVEVGEATAAAMACGLVALMVSRGSSMLMEGIEELKNLTGKWENAICLVCGSVAGLLLGYNGTMWSESVAINRIALFGVPWVMLVLVCMMRWIYAPHQRRYLFWAMFFFGICATIHQTLLAAAMGIQVAIVMAHPRLGRNFLLWNCIIYIVGLIWKTTHFFTMLDTAPVLLGIYHLVGIGSIVAYGWLAVKTQESFEEFCRDGALVAFALFLTNVPTLGLPAGVLAIAALAVFIKFAAATWKLGSEWLAVLICGGVWVLGAAFYFYEPIAGMTNPPMQWGYPRTVEGFFHALSRGQYEKASPTDLMHDPGRFLMQLGMLVRGIGEEYNWVLLFVAFLPLVFFRKMQKRERSWILGIATTYLCVGVLLTILMNPPPDRSAQDLMRVFFASSQGVAAIMIGYGMALIAAYMATHYEKFRRFGFVFGCLAIFPACITFHSSISSMFGGGGLSHSLEIFILMLLVIASLAVALHLYTTYREPGTQSPPVFLTSIAAVFTLAFLGWTSYFAFFTAEGALSFSQMTSLIAACFTDKNQYGLPVYAGVMLLAVTATFVVALFLYRGRAPLALTLGVFAFMPFYSGLCHWARSEQRGHWAGYWFGHDMFTPPFVAPDGSLSYDAKLREQAMKGTNGNLVYPEMTPNTVLYGGTDPGRFCPTYMIFCDSFIPDSCKPVADPSFDRRDVYLITQNALADHTYLWYLAAQYNRSKQLDPPFFSELARFILKDKDYETNVLARLVSPLDTIFMARGANVEKRWRTFTSWFNEQDFLNLGAYTAKLRPGDKQDALAKWLFSNFTPETQALINGQGNESRLKAALAKDLNRLLERELEAKKQLAAAKSEKDSVDQKISDGKATDGVRRRQKELESQIAELSKVQPLYDASRFEAVKLSDYVVKFISQNPQSDTRIRLNRLLLEEAYPTEIAKSRGGVYPDREIYIPTAEDSQQCFNKYLGDAQRRAQMTPPQLKGGEYVNLVTNAEGQVSVQVSGQVAVMSINGLLTEVIWQHCPDNDFFVEESFPLDWMFPYLTPYGIIMKIGHQIVPEITEEMVKRDHEFWKQYSKRFTGDIIDYNTPLSDVVAFAEKTYLRRNFKDFKGDRRFIRDDQAQKSFSKLRSSIAGIYAWRLGLLQGVPTPGQFMAKAGPERERMLREADFAFKQAFAYCPYSPEVMIRYIIYLTSQEVNRLDDALLVANTCLKLDPYNPSVVGMVQSLKQWKDSGAQRKDAVRQLEGELQSHPTNFQNAFNLFFAYLGTQDTNRALEILERVATNPAANYAVLSQVGNFYIQLGDMPRLEAVLDRGTKVAPEMPESWYNLAGVKAVQGKSAEAIAPLRQALELNAKQLAVDTNRLNLTNQVLKDPQFRTLQQMPEFKALLGIK